MNNKTRQLVLTKYGGRCAYCGKIISLQTMQVDHIVPIRRISAKFDWYMKHLNQLR
jgi:5-methylcytosine-specific restriction endonuclease McrA